MEVHAHSHTARKKWTHYLWEFLMLFLAVFCGFLAENIREHKVEGERVKSHMHDMIENLKYDTMRITLTRPQYETRILITDSIRTALKELIEGKKNTNTFYYYLLKSRETGLLFYVNPVFNTTAISQLKSSGLMRLVKPDSLNFKINDYYERQSIILASGFENLSSHIKIISEEYNSFIDLTPFHDEFSWNPGLEIRIKASNLFASDTLIANLLNDIKEQKYSLSLLNNNKSALIKLYNDFTALENSHKDLLVRMDLFKRGAIYLIWKIKQTYHFK